MERRGFATASAMAAMLAMVFDASAARAGQPIVVELFTSQGCSSCPPANATLAALADRPDLLALSFGVTYWDSLGWKDTFASPRFTARQWDYARRLGRADVGTPQMMVEGRADTTGQRLAEVEPLIQAAKARPGAAISIALRGEAVTLAAVGRHPRADVWLVRYDPRVIQVPIHRGENSGRTLPHRDVVRELTRLGAWDGGSATFTFKAASDANLRTAVFVQQGAGGPILAAAKS